MNKGEIWLVNLNPSKGREQSGKRPVLIISGNMMNHNSDLVIICPLSSRKKILHGSLVLEPNEINNLKEISQVFAFQIRTISKVRLKKLIGKIPLKMVDVVNDNLSKVLKY